MVSTLFKVSLSQVHFRPDFHTGLHPTVMSPIYLCNLCGVYSNSINKLHLLDCFPNSLKRIILWILLNRHISQVLQLNLCRHNLWLFPLCCSLDLYNIYRGLYPLNLSCCLYRSVLGITHRHDEKSFHSPPDNKVAHGLQVFLKTSSWN